MSDKKYTTRTAENGDIVRVYESGAEYNETTSKLIKGATANLITPENSNAYNRKRQEKTARLLRERILATHNSLAAIPATSASEVIAESGAMLYEQIVHNDEAYPRGDEMNEINILRFLLENNNVRIHQNETIRDLEADEAFVIGGEFVVYSVTGKELYRGSEFEEALKVLNEETK